MHDAYHIGQIVLMSKMERVWAGKNKDNKNRSHNSDRLLFYFWKIGLSKDLMYLC
ncbi:hypothetical protein [Bacillus sp. AFS088145]|uniref:hypothetical protein n=1 Tax=Bacillus sp. AFS088145 TaxID=2033514 RepID=UPI00256FB74E|nr:hypothetical protein [Bacillus sp. AFS088145]